MKLYHRRRIRPFSVVVPVYNAQLHIDQCVNSILAQGREDIEVVLVDDGSTDSSGAICDAYAAKHPSMVKVVHKENQGPLIARVEGFAVSKGRYIMSADADDAIFARCLRCDSLRHATDRGGYRAVGIHYK